MRLCITCWNLSCTNNIFSLYSVQRVKRKSSFLYTISIKCILSNNNNNVSQSWPAVQLAVILCACTGLLVQHYSNCAYTGLLVQHQSNCACTGLLVQLYSNCACTGLLVQHYSNSACTGLLVQHSLTVITINSSLTQCTVVADQMFTNVYAIS